MRRVTINCIVDEFRKKSLYKDHIEIHGDSIEFMLMPSLHDNTNNLEEVVQSILSELNPTTRSVFNLYAIDGYKHKEIGSLLGISEGTSAWHYSEARKVLKHLLSIELKP
jgi:RNA polymerase sigma-70 factor (ECF subfamily)